MASAAVEVRNLTKVFTRPLNRLRRLLRRPGPAEVTALRNVDLTIGEGEIFGLVGRNGQGKTTLVKSIADLIMPTSGSVRVFGYDSNLQSREAKRNIGLVTSDERSFYWRLTGRQNMKFFARLYGLDDAAADRRIEELLELFGMRELGYRAFREYSNGNKQRLAIARALLNDPPLLLLDEPTRSLDPIAADELRALIRDRISPEGRKTVLITSHNLAEVEQLCGRVAIISRGRIKECAALEELRAKYYDREDVAVHARVAGDNARESGGLHELRGLVEGLETELAEDGGVTVRFSRRTGDGGLHRVLERIMARGGEIAGCDTRRLGLKEILTEIEQQGDES